MQLPGPTFAACRFGGLVLALTLAGGLAAKADDIGKAVSVVPAVSGTTAGRSTTLGSGDGVVQNELIETAAAGNAKLRFIDATGLSIGPSSSVKLDRFVFAPGGTAKSFILNASKGTFRFATGNSNHAAYQILTPAAVIGVRGTTFRFTVLGRRLTLTVFSGTVIVCPLGLSRASCFAVHPGQTVAAQAGKPVTLISGGNSRPPSPKVTITAQAGRPAVVPATPVSSSASASPVVPSVLAWSGCHVGVNVGFNASPSGDTAVIAADPGLAFSQDLGNVPRSLPSRRDGPAVGGGFGCDMQLTGIVIGAETDIAYTDASHEAQVTGGPAAVTTTFRQNLNVLGTARVRFGVPVGAALLYATGGLAYGDISTRASIVPPPTVLGPTLAGSASGIQAGWTAGAGVAYALSERWLLKAEYLYYDLGENRLTTPTIANPAFAGVPPPAETGIFRTRISGNLVRAGADYRF